MSATADRTTAAMDDGAHACLARADGLELLGEVPGSGYERGATLVRRPDGQMVQLGPLLYALLEEVDGERDVHELADAMCGKLGRACDEQHVVAIAERLAQQGLLAGTESNAPARSNPLLALRWKAVITDPALTRAITTPFTWLFRPVLVAAVLVAFAAACWWVLVEQGVAAGFADAFRTPELILLLFGLGIAAAAFHEIGHAAACRYGGGRPGAMGAGIYIVWPAFYTDVTDAYRLPRRDRLRTDLGGLYFNAIVAVATVAAWFWLRIDALLLLVALQLVEMVKQLSPIIRADGYHVLADATGVPDLYAHVGPTLRRLIPGRDREPDALTGRARAIVTAWVLIVMPLLACVMLGAVLLLPKLVASTWESGSVVLAALTDQVAEFRVVDAAVSLLRLAGLALPTLGILYLTRRIVAGTAGRAISWSRGRPARRALVVGLALVGAAIVAWAWWPKGQYEPIRANDRGSLRDLGALVSTSASEPVSANASATASDPKADPVEVRPGTYVAVSLVPQGGPTEDDPVIFVITDPGGGAAPIMIASSSATPADAGSPDDASTGDGSTDAGSTDTEPAAPDDAPTTTAAAFPFAMPDAPGADDSQALALNRTDGGVLYDVAYSLVTVRDGDDVDQRNGAHAYGNCNDCTTVAVSFQVVLVVGSSRLVTPVNIAEAINGNCTSCITTAIATQLVVTLGSEPSPELIEQLNAELERLDAIDDLGADATPNQIAQQVTAVQTSINQLLEASGTLPEEDGVDEATDETTTEAPAPTDPVTSDPAAADEPAASADDPATTDPATDGGASTDESTTGDPATTEGADPATTTEPAPSTS